jgi:hypothetical protein
MVETIGQAIAQLLGQERAEARRDPADTVPRTCTPLEVA